VTLVAAGTCTIRASQPGSTYYTAAPNVDQSFAVSTNQAPTIALTMPANNSSYVAPAIVPMVATASDPDGTINRVEFYNGGVPLATATTAPYTFAWSNVAAGSYVLTAKAYDSANAITTSAAATITVNASGSTVAFVHTGDYPVGNYTQAVALGDFNRDGNPDVVALTGGVWMLSGSAAGVLQQASTLPGLVGSAVATGDLNGDGIVDVATVSGSGLQVALGNGDGTFRSPTSYAIGNGGAQRSIIAKDLNGDSKLDLAVANDTDGTVSILIGNGDGTFRAAVAYPAGTGPTGIAAGDFNGDGNMDLVAANRTGMAAVDGFTLLLGNGDGTFRAPTTKVTGTGVGYIAAGDLNGDGKLDLAIADPFGKVAILLGNGDGTFQSLFEYPAGGFALGIVIADLNGDGKLDIATANLSDNTVSILLGNGNGSFRAPMNFAVGVQPVHLAVGDLNSDGLPDLVVDNIGAATVSVLINATGKTAQAPTFTNGAPPAGPGGSPYSFTFTASGFPGSAFHLASSLTWFSFSASGTLSSASAVPGIYQGVVTASNGIAPDATQAFTIYIARKNQTITFPALPDTYIGNGTHLTGWATASSGLPVSFVSLTPSICNLLVAPPIIDLNVPAAGSCVVRAEQPGDGYFAPAPPVDRTFTVTPSPTAHLGPAGVVITAPADGAGFVAPATITLTSDAWVVSIWPPMSIYYVEYFYDGGQSAGITATYAPPPYTVTWSNVPVGTHVLTARLKYILTGDPTYYGYATSAPITIAVTAVPDQPVVTLTAPANNSGYITPASITLVASASDPVTSIARVEFYAGGVLIGSTTTAPYTFTWANGPAGTFAITARAVNSVGVMANSQPITITVDSGIATQVAAYTFNDAWDSSGLVLDILGGFAGVRQGAVTQVAAAASGPKPDTCQAASFAGGAIDIIDLPVAIIGGAKTTVAFWMYWNGGDLQMPVTWTAQGLLLSAGSFGFTTQNNNDVFGIASAFLANGWHHVVAEFTNGNVTNNRLWIDGVLQSLTQRAGAPNNANAGVTTSLRLGGQSGTASARFIGQLDEIEVFGGTMTAAHVSALFATASACAATLTLVAPYNNASYFAPATVELVATGTGGISSVQFYSGANLIGTATGTLPFALTWNGVQPGTYTLTAKSGSVTSSAVTVTVVAAGGGPTVTTSTPNNLRTFYSAGTAHLGATPTAAPGHVIAKVEFYANGTLIGWSAGPPYEFTWRNLVPGTYTITAVVIDDAGVRVASTPFTITVLAGSPSLVYYYNDVASTPIAATDGNGSLLWEESYWPYGERYAHEDSGTQNGLWYTGKPTEDATGLSYYGGRWYNPSIGRFYSVDPQRFRENKALSFNRYSYGGNNPYRFLDPDGEDFVDLFPKDAPVVTLGQTIGGLAAYSQGLITGNKALEDVASPFAVENRQLYIGAAVIVLTTGRGGKADVPKYARGEYKTLSEAQRDVVLKKDAVCTYCGTAKSDTVDHIRSQKQDWLEGGWKDSRDARSARVNDPDNLAGACRSCNSSKQDKPLGAGQGGWSPD
jgi:RHS repeat-associated protein